MSDLGMYELDDIIWGDLYQSDDHIVPHPGDEQADQHSFGCNTRKRARRESTSEGDAGGSSSEKHVCQDRTEQLKHTVYHKCRMLEKEACCNIVNNVFSSSNSKSTSEALSLTSDGMKISDASFMDTLPSGGELSGKESIRSEITVSLGDSVSYQHRFPEADNDLSFLENNGVKDSNGTLYYSWDDLGNFEDVDRMFRSSDSTFGLGQASQEDDLGWLSSDAIVESENLSKSDLTFSCPDSSSRKSMSESENTSKANGMTCTIIESELQSSSALFEGSGQLGILSFSSGTGSERTVNKDKVIPEVQGAKSINVVQQKMANAAVATNKMIDEPIKQVKLPNQHEYHKNDLDVGSSSYFHDADVQGAGLQPVEALNSNSFGYLHSDTTFMSSDFNFPSDQNSMHLAQSAIKSENGLPTCLITEDSYSLNQMQAHDSQESSLQLISFAVGEKSEWMNQPKKCQASSNGIPRNIDFGAQTSMSTTISNEKPIHYSGKGHMEGLNKGLHQKLGPSVAQDSSMSSGLVDISIEATSFHQLQGVMEQLDLRTKLCIRDSLYRLARSAEQRHQYVKLNGGPTGDRDSMLAEGSTKFTDLMDMETDTNPIDRSIAHLLFHRPAYSPILDGRDAFSFYSSTPGLIHGWDA